MLANKPPIPNEIQNNWQRIVNLMANIMQTPAALIRKVYPDEIEVFVSSNTKENPYKTGAKEKLNSALYCETVMHTKKPLHVADAMSNPDWDKNPDLKPGMTYYKGYPLLWPNDEVFGTICILDNKNNVHASASSDLMFEFQQIIEKDLKIIFQEQQVWKANELVRKNEQRQKLYFEQTPLAVIEWDLDFRVIRWNPAAEIIFGYTSDEAIGQHASLIIPDKYKQHVDQVWNDLLKQKGGTRSTNENITKEGKTLFCDWFNTTLTTTEGKILGVTSMVLDITDRIEAEQALQEKEANYKNLFENAVLGIYRTSPDGKILMINKALLQMLGFSSLEELQKRNLETEGFSEDNSRSIFEHEMKDKGFVSGYEATWLKANGEKLYVRESSIAVRDANNNIIYYEGIVEDITLQKQAQNALLENEKKYQDLIEKAKIGIATDDIEGNLTYCNKQYLDLFGYSMEELKDLSIASFAYHEDLDMIMKYHKERIEGKDVASRYECRAAKKDSTLIYIEVDVVPIYENNKIIGTRSYTWDISKRKKAEEIIRESAEKYKKLYDTIVHGIVFQNAQGEILSANPAAERILGLSLDQMQGRTSIDPRWKSIHEDGIDFPGETHPAMVALNTGMEVKNQVMGVFNPKINEYTWINVNSIPQFKDGEDKPFEVYTTFEDITDRKKNETDRKWKSSIDTALANLYSPIISPLSSMFDIALMLKEKAQELTQSTQCYVGTIDLETGNLVSHTLTEMMMNGQCAILQKENQRIAFPMSEDGTYGRLWGHSLNTKEAFYTNDVKKHFASKGIPVGHITIEKYMSVPVMLEQELVGQIGLANPSRDYNDKDIIAIKALAEFFALGIQKLRYEENLKIHTEELEAFNNSMVDREMRIIELKEEINNYCKELNRSVRFPEVWDQKDDGPDFSTRN
ncbi:MAG: PAS domain S-box protein [Bacteroidales bacterium]|nr:PAS domain S-box protein [Bacteroidales bacterium]